MRALAIFLSLIVAAAVQARIGETTLQFIDRYGPPKDTTSSKIYDKNSPLVEGAVHHVYEYQGWNSVQPFCNWMGRQYAWITRKRALTS
jgi:hypothetical protein